MNVVVILQSRAMRLFQIYCNQCDVIFTQTNQRFHHGSGGERRASPHRLVVRTSRRGRDNPGSTPGEDIFLT